MTMAAPEVVAGVLRIPVYDLAHGENARGELGDVTELANSLRTLGQQQPVLVEQREDGKWSVWDGNRRLKAARQAGFAHLLAIPRKTPLTPVQRVLRQLGMHATARQFDPIAEGKAVEWLMFADDGPHLSREDIARVLGRSEAWVKGRIDLLQLKPDEQASVATGRTTVAAALQMVAVRRGTSKGDPGRFKPTCADGSSCGCRCHKRNQEVA